MFGDSGAGCQAFEKQFKDKKMQMENEEEIQENKDQEEKVEKIQNGQIK